LDELAARARPAHPPGVPADRAPDRKAAFLAALDLGINPVVGRRVAAPTLAEGAELHASPLEAWERLRDR
jgi:hypothetical protein